MNRLGVVVLLLAVGCILPLCLGATPYAATWQRESLLGENGHQYFLLVSVWENPGSYYDHTETQFLRSIDKKSGVIVEEVPLRRTEFSIDPNTDARTVTEQTEVTFDLAGYLRARAVSVPFSGGWQPRAELDSMGLYVQSASGRVVILPMDSLKTRLPELGPEAAILGIEFTSAVPDSGLGRVSYYRLRSDMAGSDADTDEIIIMVPDSVVANAAFSGARRPAGMPR